MTQIALLHSDRVGINLIMAYYFLNASLVEWPPVDSVLTTHPTLSVFSHASYQMSLAAEK